MTDYTNAKIALPAHRRLRHTQAEMAIAFRRTVTISDAINMLIDSWDSQGNEPAPEPAQTPNLATPLPIPI